LLAGGGAAFVADGLNATVNSLSDLADLGADVLAVIPVLPMLGGVRSSASGNVALVSTAGMYLLMVAGLLTWAWLWMNPTTSLWP
jgi:hypothetical protein